MSNAVIKPLFEKLVDEDTEVPFEKTPKRFSSLIELQSSIIEDLSRLLNTRIAIFWKNRADKSLYTPFSYGINITSDISAENVFAMQELEARIEKVIAQFEPRLMNAKAHVQGTGSDPSFLFVNIDAIVIVENRRVPLSFPVVLNT